MVTLYFHFHHNNFPTTADRDFILGLHVYLTQSHTLNVQGQGHEFGVKREKIKLKVNVIGKYLSYLACMCITNRRTQSFDVDMSRSCILTFARIKVLITTDSHINVGSTTDKKFKGHKTSIRENIKDINIDIGPT